MTAESTKKIYTGFSVSSLMSCTLTVPQYNLAICVSAVYEGYVTVEMEYHNLTSLIM